MEKLILFLCLSGIWSLAVGEQLDILAFDFYRKFGHYVHLGECADVSRPDGKTTTTTKCHLKKDGDENFQAIETTHEAILEIKTAEDLFSYLGLCEGNAVSRLGLLHGSECVAVDIAKSISFHEATYTRAMFGTYQRGIVMLGDTSGQDGGTSAETSDPHFYPKYIKYGSKEMILVSLTYRTEADAIKSKRIECVSEKLSDQLATLLKDPKDLESIKILRLSTADRKYLSWSFPLPLAASAVERVKDEEAEMAEVKLRVLSKLAMDPYYMNYVMWPFSGHTPAHSGLRKQKTMLWRNVTLCEIQLTQVMKIGEAVKKMKCVGEMISSRPCKRLSRRLARVQRNIQKNIHSARATWYQLSTKQKKNLTQKCQKMCLMNENKMDRSVNKVLFGSGPAPVFGRSRSAQGQWSKRWSKKKSRKMRRNKKKDGKRRKRKNNPNSQVQPNYWSA